MGCRRNECAHDSFREAEILEKHPMIKGRIRKNLLGLHRVAESQLKVRPRARRRPRITLKFEDEDDDQHEGDVDYA